MNPAALFRFQHGYSVWTYTSADAAITTAGGTFLPYAITGTPPEATAELQRTGVTITVPRDCEVAQLFQAGSPGSTVAVTIQLVDRDAPDTVLAAWGGRVRSVEWGESVAELSCDSWISALKRTGLRSQFQAVCNHLLYSPKCGVAKAGFAVTGTLTAVSGQVISAAAFATKPDGWFAGGFVEFGGFKRMVIAHTGADLTLLWAIPGLAVDDVVTAYAGCDKLQATCASKFSNAARFGGYPFIPVKNPFQGSLS